MSDLLEIKKRLVQEDKIERLLESIDCEYISSEQSGELITAMLPESFHSPNKRSVQVRMNESTYSVIRTMPDFKGGSIFDLISYIYLGKRGEEIDKSLNDAKRYVCNLFGWGEYLSGNKKIEKKEDHLAPLKAIMKLDRRSKARRKKNDVLSERVMNDYYLRGKPLPFHDWIEEGISYQTQVMYGVGFDIESKRVVFPLCNRMGEIVGVKGRIMKNEDSSVKYIYLHKCLNSLEWFNFHYAQPFILSEKRVYIFEAEKSCMKAFDKGVFNTLAIGSSDMSSEQVGIIKKLGLDVEIVLCYDKGIDLETIKEQCALFKGRTVSAMYDMDDLLQDKESPMDSDLETWETLCKNNIYEIDLEE